MSHPNPPGSTAPPSSTTTSDPPASNAELEGRLDRVEGTLGRIEQLLTGARGGGQTGQTGQGSSGAAPGGQAVDAAAIQRQVLEQIQEADRRRAAEQTETRWRDSVNQAVEAIRRERQPREPETGLRGVLQRMVIGKQRG